MFSALSLRQQQFLIATCGPGALSRHPTAWLGRLGGCKILCAVMISENENSILSILTYIESELFPHLADMASVLH